MRYPMLAAVAAAMLVCGASSESLAAPSAAVKAAVANTSRPAADTARDADRKPAQVLTFAGVKAGDKVGELIPGGGYYTRLLSALVGPTGKVYALVPQGMLTARPEIADTLKAIGANVVLAPFAGPPAAPEPLDVVWTSENYHDFHNSRPGGPPADVVGFDNAVFAALKPGGVFLVEDHAAAAGAGPAVTSTLHRIDPAQVKAEIEAAGFKLEASSSVLANKADNHTLPVFDKAIQGHTDKLLMKFRKPR